MGNFFNNGPKILKLIVRVCIYHTLINIYKKNCWFENWSFKNFFLKINRSQTDYNEHEYSETGLNQTSLGQTYVFGIGRYSVYTG